MPSGKYKKKKKKVNTPSSYASVCASVSYLRFLFAINHKINCLSVSCILGLDKRGAHENENENATKAWKCGLPQLAACDRSLLVFGPGKPSGSRRGSGGRSWGNFRAVDAACDTFFFFVVFVPPQEVWVVRGSVRICYSIRYCLHWQYHANAA